MSRESSKSYERTQGTYETANLKKEECTGYHQTVELSHRMLRRSKVPKHSEKLDNFRENSLNSLITVPCLLPPSVPSVLSVSIYYMPLSDTEHSSWLFIHFTTATAKCSAPKKDKDHQL